MRLLNEMVYEAKGVDFVGYIKGFPLDHKTDFKVGNMIYIDDFEVGKFRNMCVLDEYQKEDRKIASLLKNANRRGVVSSIKRMKQVRNCGKIKYITYFIGVKFFSDGSDESSSISLVITNPSFVKKCG